MRILNDRFEVEGLLRAVRRARNRVLFLDYDGTLAPFTLERDQAQPYPGVVALLSELCLLPRHRTVFVSGRPARELAGLLPLDPMPSIWGSNGMEELTPGGRLRTAPVSDEARKIIDRETVRLEAVLGAGRVERKPVAVAVHVRGLSEDEAAVTLDALHGPWKDLVRSHRLTVWEFDGGLELSAGTRSKGDAVAHVLAGLEPPYASAFLGDDETDESAFRAMRGRGASILVRPVFRPTFADVWIRPPDELLSFLGRWRDAALAAVA